MNAVLDTNCFIDAVNPASRNYPTLHRIFKARDSGRLTLMASYHSLHELMAKPDAALDLARTAALLPHIPIGTWGEQVAPWEALGGTWDDARRMEEIQQDLDLLARSGTSIRDRGAYVDALYADVDALVTSDRQLVDNEPAGRIASKYGVRVLTPAQLSAEIPDEK